MKERFRGSNDDGEVDDRNRRRFNGGRNPKTKIEKRNMQRLGGRGLSLQAFANAKSRTKNDYNPAFIKKQKEFYKNAKFVKKYKRSLRQQEQTQTDVPMATRDFEERNETEEATKVNHNKRKNKTSGEYSLKELYEKKREEEERARMERELSIQAKKEQRQRAQAQRKSLREKMFKKTKSGQPVMKYRIEHLLGTIQGSSS